MDFLSMLTLRAQEAARIEATGFPTGRKLVSAHTLDEDVIIFHSTALKRRAAETIEANDYDHVSLFLDTDTTGRATTNDLIKELGPARITDLSRLYAGHNDLNDWLMTNKAK